MSFSHTTCRFPRIPSNRKASNTEGVIPRTPRKIQTDPLCSTRSIGKSDYRSSVIGQVIRLREALRSHALSSRGNFFDSAADMQQDDDVLRRYGTEAFKSDSVIRISIQALKELSCSSIAPAISELMLLLSTCMEQSIYEPSNNISSFKTTYLKCCRRQCIEIEELSRSNSKLQEAASVLKLENDQLTSKLDRMEEELVLEKQNSFNSQLKEKTALQDNESLKNQLKDAEESRELLLQEISQMEQSVFKSHMEQIKAEHSASEARVECDRITVAHNVQQRLLNRVDYDTERISMRPRTDVLGLDNEEDIHAELEQIYRDRDRVQELFQKEREEHEHLIAKFRRENETKNLFRQRVALVEQKLDISNLERETLLQCRTPRPEWAELREEFQRGIALCSKKPSGETSADSSTVGKIRLILKTLEDQALEKSKHDLLLAGLSEGESLTSQLHIVYPMFRHSPKSNSQYLQSFGDHAGIPKFLRCKGHFVNRRFERKKIELLTRDFWHFHAEKNSKSQQKLDEVLLLFFQSKAPNRQDAFELAYNTVDALDRYRWRSDCALFLEVIRGRLHEDAHAYLLKIRKCLLDHLQRIERADRGSKSVRNMLKQTFFEAVARCLPLKNEHQITAYKRALTNEQQGFTVEYPSIFKGIIKGEFLQEIGIQFVEESVELRNALSTEVLSLADENEQVPMEHIKQAFLKLNTNITTEDVVEATRNIHVSASGMLDARTLLDVVFRRRFVYNVNALKSVSSSKSSESSLSPTPRGREGSRYSGRKPSTSSTRSRSAQPNFLRSRSPRTGKRSSSYHKASPSSVKSTSSKSYFKSFLAVPTKADRNNAHLRATSLDSRIQRKSNDEKERKRSQPTTIDEERNVNLAIEIYEHERDLLIQVQPISPMTPSEVMNYPDSRTTTEKGNERASLGARAEDNAHDDVEPFRVESPVDSVDEKEHSLDQIRRPGSAQAEECNDEVRLTEHGPDQAKTCVAEPVEATEPISSQSISSNEVLNIGEEDADVEKDIFCSLLPDSSELPQYRSSTSMSDRVSDEPEKKLHQRYFSSEL